MAIPNNQTSNNPTSPSTLKPTSRSQLQSTPRSWRSSTVNDSTGTPAPSSRSFKPTHVVAVATQTSARSVVSVPPSPRSGRGHVHQKSPSARTSRSLSAVSSKYSMTTQESEKSLRDTDRSMTTSAMSTARAEATLKKLEAERKKLEYRLKKVEEELEQEEALGKEGLNKRLHGNSSRGLH